MTDKAEEQKAPGKAEKSQTASDAAPARTHDTDPEYTYEQVVESSGDLFDVPGYVVVGAAQHAKINLTKPIKKSVMKKAIDEFLAREVKEDA